MSKPIISDNKPIKVSLNKNEEYYFCVCGRSNNQPFCDGSHKSTNLKPKQFTAQKSGEAYLCRCKHSGNAPYCDGTHKQFSDDQVGKEGPGVKADGSQGPEAKATKQEPTMELMQVMARACGHNELAKFNINDLATWHREMAFLSGVRYSGMADLT